MQDRPLDGLRSTPAGSYRVAAEFDRGAARGELPMGAESALALDDDADFSEEFGPGLGFAGGSGFRYGDFELWV